jgi:hypothetical protein
MILPTLAAAQSLIPKALNEPLNLTARCRRGDAQKMVADIEFQYLKPDGTIASVKQNQLQYEQLCLANSPEKLTYQIQIDTLKIGTRIAPSSRGNRSNVMSDFVGYSFEMSLEKKIPARDGCYANDIRLADNMHYMAGFEFLSNFMPIEILEQLHFTLGRRLALIGDTARVALPGAICIEVPKVIESYRVEQQPYHLTLSGITLFRESPCAIVSIESDPSPLQIEFPSTKGSWTGSGSTSLTGQFLVSLDRGTIVSATLRERLVASQTRPDGTTVENPVVTITRLRQAN